jgi:hypothetical protein
MANINNFKVINEAKSTNGRWGMAVVSTANIDLYMPQQGRLEDLGTTDGVKVYKFTEDDTTGRWYMFGGDLEPVAGCKKVAGMDLQSGNRCALVVGGEFFAVRDWGYRRRSSVVFCYENGAKVNVPTPVLLAMGVIKGGKDTPVDVEPPKLESPLAEALQAWKAKAK